MGEYRSTAGAATVWFVDARSRYVVSASVAVTAASATSS